jgi:hypothetical protein
MEEVHALETNGRTMATFPPKDEDFYKRPDCLPDAYVH